MSIHLTSSYRQDQLKNSAFFQAFHS